MSDFEGVFQPLCDWYRRHYEALCEKYKKLKEYYKTVSEDYMRAMDTVTELSESVNELSLEVIHYRRLSNVWEQRARDFARQYDDMVYIHRDPSSEHHPRSIYTTYFPPNDDSDPDSTESEDLLDI